MTRTVQLTGRDCFRTLDGFQVVVRSCPFCGVPHYYSRRESGFNVASNCLDYSPKNRLLLPRWETIPQGSPEERRSAWAKSRDAAIAHERHVQEHQKIGFRREMLYTVPEVAELLGMSKFQVYERLRGRTMPRVRLPMFPGRVFVPKIFVDAIVTKHAVHALKEGF